MNALPTTLDSLHVSWHRTWLALQARGDGVSLMKRLIAAYEEPHRKYHGVQHLAECIALFAKHRDLAGDPGEVEMALWFHDAIYDLKGGDNEARSAQWAERELAGAGVDTKHLQAISAHVLATRHDAVAQDRDQKLMVDIDLAILGSDTQRFAEYEAQVAAEYSWVPEAIFRSKRCAILHAFLQRTTIYQTQPLRELFERRARENLSASIARLTAV
jgi:predicted metal-dependent HD superfamily phosphohydrolase